jgi:uncharacterized membrane protein YphA (DoxX/SURF4 family)
MIRRLYTSFPTGATGIGLLLLRVLSGAGLAEQSTIALFNLLAAPESQRATLGEVAATSGLIAALLLLIGLWTPIAAGIAAISALLGAGPAFSPLESILFAVLSIVVALVGPGVLSLDARLFGWRQIRFPRAGTESERR